MTKRKTSPITQIHVLKVTLKDVKPPVWRRLAVSSDTTLVKLHKTIQAAMGWSDYHLHQFFINGCYYSIPHPDDSERGLDERRFSLATIAPQPGMKFRYDYDFGDGWEHAILVEKVLEPDPNERYPVCLAGKRACPPEDVGGPWGYEEFLAVMADPKHPEHDEREEWIGGPFDPEEFSVDDVNIILNHKPRRTQK
jgi:hypothetical protein